MRRNSTDRTGRRTVRLGVVAVGILIALVVGALVIFSSPGSQIMAETPPAAPSSGVVQTTAENSIAGAPGPAADQAASDSPTGRHPLDAALAIAEKIDENLHKNVKDYTCILIKQERIDGKLKEPEYIQAKIRQETLAVYFKFIRPNEVKGREVLYVAGANDGNMLVREASGLKRALGIIWLKPNSILAMEGNRYPITNVGMAHLTHQLIEVAQKDRKYGEVEVHFFKNAKVNDRTCTLIEVVHPTPRTNFLFYKARIYVDDELNVPIRYEAYLWPKEPGGDPPLDESYTYVDLKLNVGLTPADFDYRNPKYHFVDK
jgi:uncharacterized protein DUF1571